MRKSALSLGLLGATLGLFALATPVQAQPLVHTFVSGVGSDANPCTRASPCLSFTGALNKTVIGGQIECLDSGRFGGVTITKSITIDCSEGRVSTGIGIFINIPVNPEDPFRTVILRGLRIDGVRAIGGDSNGIRIDQALAVHVENVKIYNFGQRGILWQSTATGKLTVSNTTIFNNTGAGIEIVPLADQAVVVALNNVELKNNGHGLVVNSVTSNQLINVLVKNSLVASNNGNGISSTAGARIRVTVHETGVMANVTGIVSTGANSLFLLHQSTVSGNGTGCQVNGGLITSFQTNMLSGNITTQCTPTHTFAPQ